jgi:chromosome segregation ATPase
MDEIDAALDYKNVAIVGKYIKEGVCKQGSSSDQHVAIAG